MPVTPIQAADRRDVLAPEARVWDVLCDVASYPRWWPASVAVRVVEGAPGPVGADLEITPRGGRPFRCRVEAVEPRTRIALRYHGLVEGHGAWVLAPIPGGVRVTYTIDVVAHGWLVAIVARLTSLAEAHSGPMRDVLAALEREATSA